MILPPYKSVFTESSEVPEFKIVDHGVEHSQYFQGHGTSFTKWDEAVTGHGMSAKEAIEDALEQIAMTREENKPANFETFASAVEQEAKNMYGDKYEKDMVGEVQKKSGEYETEEDLDSSELYYYVSIDYMLDADKKEKPLEEKKLTYAQKKALPKKDFVYPKEKKYPIDTENRARNALARVAQHGTEAEKKRVKAAVHKKFPEIGEKKEESVRKPYQSLFGTTSLKEGLGWGDPTYTTPWGDIHVTKLPNGNLEIKAGTDFDKEEVQEKIDNQMGAAEHDFFDGPMGGMQGNGWDILSPEQVGALTDSIIIAESDQVRKDEDGEVVDTGHVYWYPNYAIRSFLEDLVKDGVTIFTGEGEPLKD